MFDGFVFSADWHLSALTWQHRPRLRGDTFFALQQVVDYCLKHHKPLIAGGDLFDKDRPDSAAVAAAFTQLSRMEYAGLPVYYIQGQHERAAPPWLAAHAWPQHVDRAQFTIPGCGFSFYGLDWRPAHEALAAYAAIPTNVNVVVGHQVWHEYMGSITRPELSLADVPPHVLIVLTGDFHQHQITQHQTAHGPRQMVSPGALTMRTIKEPAHHGFYDYAASTGAFISIAIQSRPMLSAMVRNETELDALAQAVEQARAAAAVEVSEPIVRVTYRLDEWPAAHRQIYDRLDGAHIFEINATNAIALPEFSGDAAPAVVDDNTTLTELIQAASAEVPQDIVREILAAVQSDQAPRLLAASLVAELQAAAEKEVV